MQERYLVKHIGEPLAFLLPVNVKAHQSIAHWLTTSCDLGSEALL